MSRKRHKPEEIIAKLRQVEVLAAQGRPMAEAIRSICQTALNIDPGSASKIDPSEACGVTLLISPAKRVGVAQPG